MDPLIWLVLSGIVGIVLLVAVYFNQKLTEKTQKERPAGVRIAGQGAMVVGGVRRSRNIRARVAAVQRARGQIESIAEDSQEGEDEESQLMDRAEEDDNEQKLQTGKIGTKKLKRIQEKAEKKVAREQEEAMREDRKKREALRDKERKQEQEAELASKRKEEEEQARLRKELEKKEHEEYLALRESFVVENEGQGASDEETKSVQDFINYLKNSKIVYLEDLAAEFSMKTQDAIVRVQSLQESGELTGVMDDRGKFIFISQEELQAVATFIKQRGRVSITDLVTSSNTLINLQPDTITV